MRRMLTIVVVVLVGLLHCIPAWTAHVEAATAARNYNVEFYDRWANLPTDTLMAWARRFYLQEDSQRDSALLCYTIVANRYYEGRQSDSERERSIDAMNDIGYLFFYSYYDYQQAYTWFQKALTLAERHNLPHVKTYVLLNLGNLLTLLNAMMETDSNTRALEYYKQAWRSAVDEGSWPLAMVIGANLSDTTTIDWLEQDLQRVKVPAGTPMYGYLRHLVGMTQNMRAGNYQRALALCDSMEQSIDAPVDPERDVVYCYSMRATLYSMMGNPAMALDWLNRAKQLVERDSIRDLRVEIEKGFYDFYNELGDKTKAREHQLAYLTMRDSLLNQGKLVKANELYFLNQLQEVNKQAELVAHRMSIWRWIVLGLALVIAVIGALLVFLRRKNKQLEEDRRRMYLQIEESINMEQTITKYRQSSLDDTSKDDLADRIVEAMKQTDVICDENFNREALATIVGTTPSNISQVLSERLGKNFSQLLNEYRVREACRRFSDQEQYGKLTIEAIGASVGFKSRSNFAVTFKKFTGLTPSQYLHEARKQDA